MERTRDAAQHRCDAAFPVSPTSDDSHDCQPSCVCTSTMDSFLTPTNGENVVTATEIHLVTLYGESLNIFLFTPNATVYFRGLPSVPANVNRDASKPLNTIPTRPQSITSYSFVF